MTGPITNHVPTGTHGTGAEPVPWPDDPAWLRQREEGDRRIAEQPSEQPVTAPVGEQLIRLMVPDLDPDLVQLMLSRTARSAAYGHGDHEVRRGGDGKPRSAPLQDYVELLALIRDAGLDRAQLCAILGLDPDAQPTGDDNPHPPRQ